MRGPTRDQTAFHGRALARDLPLVAELIADLVRAPHFDEDASRAREAGNPVRAGEAMDAPDDLVHDHLFEAAFEDQPMGRSVLGSEATVRAATAERCAEWIGAVRSVAPDPRGERQGRWRAAGRAGRAAVRGHGRRGGAAGLLRRHSPADAQRATRSRAGASVPRAARRRRGDPGYAALSLFARRWAAGRRRGCSSSCARTAGSPIRSTPGTRVSRCGMVGIGCATERRARRKSIQMARQLVAETAEKSSEAELDRARALAKAGHDDEPRKLLGAGELCREPIEREGRLSSRQRSRTIGLRDTGRSEGRRRTECWLGRARSRASGGSSRCGRHERPLLPSLPSRGPIGA